MVKLYFFLILLISLVVLDILAFNGHVDICSMSHISNRKNDFKERSIISM